jgi:hypothetical protein
MAEVTPKLQDAADVFTEVTLLKLAREVAMDLHPLEDILKRHKVSKADFTRISKLTRFQALLTDAVTTWHGALNTHERTKLKAAALVEEWLPELNTRMHDPQESLNAKIEGGKLAARIAEMGLSKAGIEGGIGEKVSITINMGADSKLEFKKEAPPQIIDVTPEGN